MNDLNATNGGGAHPSDSRDRATATSRGDRASMLTAMHSLEAALAAGIPARETEWRERVRSSAKTLLSTMQHQSDEFEAKRGLLQNVIQDAPRLVDRVGELRMLHHAALDLLSQLTTQVEPSRSSNTLSTDEVRSQFAEVISTIRRLQAIEADLIYEAYQVDLGGGD